MTRYGGCHSINRIPRMRHVTTSAREPGESLAMHQFAVWRVSNGSRAAVPSTVAHRQSTFKCGRTPTPANAAVIARTVWAQFRRRSNLSQPGRASRPPIVAVPRRRPIWQWLRRPGRFLAEWRQSQCRGPDRAPRSGLQCVPVVLRVRSGPVSGVGSHNSVTVRVMMMGLPHDLFKIVPALSTGG